MVSIKYEILHDNVSWLTITSLDHHMREFQFKNVNNTHMTALVRFQG